MIEKAAIPNRSGIYFFFLPKLKVGYIGRTNDLQRRFYEHTVQGSHKKVITKYAKTNDDLVFSILEFTDGHTARQQKVIESFWLKKLKVKGIALLNITNPLKEKDLPEPKPVLMIDPVSMQVVKRFKSSFETTKKGFDASTVVKCCKKSLNKKGRGQLKHRGYFWLYEEDYLQNKNAVSALETLYEDRQRHCTEKKRQNGSKNSKPIEQYSLSGSFIKNWTSASEAAKTLGLKQAAINHCLTGRNKTSGNFIWKYKE